MWFRNSAKTQARIADLEARLAKAKAERDAAKQKQASLKARLDKIKELGLPFERMVYNSDGLSVWAKSLDFMQEPKFQKAYSKGERSGHSFGDKSQPLHIEWRVHVAVWAAQQALKIKGDFVECGVNTGILSLAIADYLDFANSGRHFYLFDTFCGAPEEQLDEAERERGLRTNSELYPDVWEIVQKNFAPYPNMHLVRGMVPDTLTEVNIGEVAYLSIDMNVAYAELAAMEHFWPKLQPGAIVVLDDYGWEGHELQRSGLDAFALRNSTSILTLPTGQGLMIKA